jgi:diadenosine tetraphosphatase ApaH/serine/threonine PP2A family protein phosphatase
VEAAVAVRTAAADAGTALYIGRYTLPYDVFVNRVPADHIRFLESLRFYHRTADCLCVHGGLDVRIADVRDQTPEALMWGAGGFPNGYEGAEIVVYGHHDNAVVNAEGWPVPTVVGRTIGIDTISHGILTAIRLPDQRIYQSARYGFAEPDV